MAAKKTKLATESARFTLRLPLDCELDSDLADYLYAFEKNSHRAEAIRGIARAGFSLLIKHRSEQDSFMDMRTLGYDDIFNRGTPSENAALKELKQTNEMLSQQVRSKDEQLQQMQFQLASVQQSFNSLLAIIGGGNLGLNPMNQPQQLSTQLPSHNPHPSQAPVQSQQPENMNVDNFNVPPASSPEPYNSSNRDINDHAKDESVKGEQSIDESVNLKQLGQESKKQYSEEVTKKDGDSYSLNEDEKAKPDHPIFADMDDDEEDFMDDRISGILDDLEKELEETFTIDDEHIVDPLDGFLEL